MSQCIGKNKAFISVFVYILLYFAVRQKTFARSQNGLDFLSLEKLMRKFSD
nr:MAG TPA: hypothetical protein [Caudoviricetes sp.]